MPNAQYLTAFSCPAPGLFLKKHGAGRFSVQGGENDAVKFLKLMPDYDCWPLWAIENWGPGNVDSATLPLSEQMIARLYAWAEAFTQTLNQDCPPEAGFPNREAEERFEREGLKLWLELRAQLQTDYCIKYHSSEYHKLFDSPEEWAQFTRSWNSLIA